ncbi:hypothetical protein PspS04_14425 [Pseudomonas sp. S04]|nr:hypothetical protein PspS04_14425 [Pseudomonas sp. S04]QHF33964.1 hypothetical protein PspS19_14430 [Pseudomonas sp. S19]
MLVFTGAKKTCGSELARDSGVSVNSNVECDSVIAGKPAPTGIGDSYRVRAISSFMTSLEPP